MNALLKGGAGDGETPIGIQAPFTTLTTPRPIVLRRLLAYEEDRHLMPSVNMYAKQVSMLL